MAKVNGPLFSLDARNKVGDAIVYSIWKGRNYVRSRIVPHNPKSDDQAAARLHLGSVGKNNKMIQCKSKGDPGDSDLYTSILAKTPADQSWMSFFAAAQIGPGSSTIRAARAAYALLDQTKKGYWTTAAATIPLSGFDIGYGTDAPITPGEQLFICAYGAYTAGLDILTEDPSDMTQTDITAFAAAYKASQFFLEDQTKKPPFGGFLVR